MKLFHAVRKSSQVHSITKGLLKYTRHGDVCKHGTICHERWTPVKELTQKPNTNVAIRHPKDYRRQQEITPRTLWSRDLFSHRPPYQEAACKRLLHSSVSEVTKSQNEKQHTEFYFEVTDAGKTLVMTQTTTGNILRFNATWLRHNCQCEMCIHPHSGQRTIEPAQLLPNYTLKHVQLSHNDETRLQVTWEEEDHNGIILMSTLSQNDYSLEERQKRFQDRIPSVCKGTIPTLQYQDIVDSERGLWEWLSPLNDVGITLVKNVPVEDGMVKQVAEKVWTVMPTIYGEVFQVMSTDEPINIAYSSDHLGFHMDLVYYESPPGIQLLHCKKFDDCVEGGESLTVDAWYEAEQLRKHYPHDFEVLTKVPATFQKHHYKREHPVHMTYQRPHIVLGYNGQITNINWAPSFEGPLYIPEEDIEPYYRAYHRYAQLLEKSETRLELRLEVGDLLAFNNRRILHGRKSFIMNGGTRHLEGCYLNIDEFKSKVEILAQKFNNGKPAKWVLNQSVV